MSLIHEFTHGDSYIRINSDGWSGDVLTMAPVDEEDRKFQFDIDFTLENGQYGTSWVRTDENSYGFVSYSSAYNHGAVGISLEHMGDGWWDGRYCQQFVGRGDAAPNTRIPAFGCTWRDTDPEPEDLNMTDAQMNVHLYTYFSAYQQYAGTATSGFQTIMCDPNCNPIQQYIGWVTGTFKTEITTDLPIFATDAELLAWCKDPTNPELIATMLNPPEDIEKAAEEAYAASQRYYYLRNKFRAISNGSEYNVTINNFNIKPYGKGRICLYKTAHESLGGGTWYSYYLKGTSSYNYEFKSAPWNSFRWSDDDTDVTEAYVVNRVNSIGYVKKSATYSRADVEFIVEYADTNIPIFGSEDLADQYLDEEIDIDQAENYDDIIQEEQKHILPPWGEEDTEADNGTNIQDYSIGARMFWLNGQELEGFFAAVYDPANLNDILDNNGLFGQNQINCIQSIMSLPVPPTNFATSGGHENIKLGGWDSDVGGFVIKRNNKLWEVGSTYMAPVFNDFRDLEPYQQLFISLPFCGLHALSLSKYLGHTLSVKYACDLTSGSCTAHIYSDGVEYDAFDGNMASFRPITALDQQSQISAMLQSVTKLIEPTIDLVAGGGDVVGGALTGNVGSAISGGLQGAVALPKMAFSAIEAKNAFTQKPTTFKGGFLGALGLFGNRRCHLIVAQRNTVRATNELETIGYPSGYGGFVGSFSGYLQCSSFKMAEGFTGTAEEAAEIIAMMAEGVYL